MRANYAVPFEHSHFSAHRSVKTRSQLLVSRAYGSNYVDAIDSGAGAGVRCEPGHVRK